MSAPEEEGVFAGAGRFRVDRAKALETLARFGHADARPAVLGLVRCAVLGGATRVEIRGAAETRAPRKAELTPIEMIGLEVAFDGRPFTADELRDPFEALIESGADRPRQALLARALLTFSRAHGAELSVTSGGEGSRFQLSMEVGESGEGLRRLDGDGPTVVRVLWARDWSSTAPRSFDAIINVAESLRCCPIPVQFRDVWTREIDVLEPRSRIVDAYVPAEPPSDELPAERLAREPAILAFETKTGRGAVGMHMHPAPTLSEVELCSSGVLIERLRDVELPVPVRAFIDDSRFKVDLSAAAIVRDPAHEDALKELGRRAAELAARVAKEHVKIMAELRPALARESARRSWKETLEGRLEEPELGFFQAFFGGKDELEFRRRAHWAAVRTRWLRWAARSALEHHAAPAGLRDALRAAPLFLATDGSTLSLDELGKIRKKFDEIPSSRHFGPPGRGDGKGSVLWISSARDLPLLPEGWKVQRS